MTKCLVTRLKAAIQNDDLPLFNTIKLTTHSISPNAELLARLRISTHGGDGVTIKVDGDGYFATSYANLSDETKRLTETTVTTTSSTGVNFFFKKGAYNLYLYNASNIKKIMINGQSSSGLVTVLQVDLSEFKNNPGIMQLDLNQASAAGSINDLPSTISILYLLNTPNVTGNLDELARKCVFTNIFIGNTSITGSVENFVAGQVSQGVTELTISQRGFGTRLTFGGIVRNIENDRCLSWNGTDKIIIGNDTTVEASTSIWVKGATSEEISAWEAAGKTVVVVDDDGE